MQRNGARGKLNAILLLLLTLDLIHAEQDYRIQSVVTLSLAPRGMGHREGLIIPMAPLCCCEPIKSSLDEADGRYRLLSFPGEIISLSSDLGSQYPLGWRGPLPPSGFRFQSFSRGQRETQNLGRSHFFFFFFWKSSNSGR